MGGSTTIIFLLGLGIVCAVTFKRARDRLHARLEALRARLGLTETLWEEKGLMSLLTGRKGTTQLALAGRLWGPIQVRSTIPAPVPLGLSLTPQGSGANLRGMQDIQVGVSDLDAHFQVQGEHPAATIRFLREERTQRALRSLVSADPKAAVTHGEVRLSVANPEASGQLERTVQLANSIARELAEATGAQVPPEATPEAEPAMSPQGSHGEEPFVTTEVVNGLIQPRFSPGYLAAIQRVHAQRRMLLRCLYLVSGAWISVLIMDRSFEAGILFDFPRRDPRWKLLGLVTCLVIVLSRAVLRRCASCGSPIGEGYGVTRVLAQHPIKCTNCMIELQ